jgi:hypothetical protein
MPPQHSLRPRASRRAAMVALAAAAAALVLAQAGPTGAHRDASPTAKAKDATQLAGTHGGGVYRGGGRKIR